MLEGKIFLSYRRSDTSGYTGRLHDHLADRWGGSNIFLDIDNISPGIDYIDAIDKVLNECNIFILIVGPNWLSAGSQAERRIDSEDDFHRLEIQQALTLGLRILPVLVGGAMMPRTEELPESIRRVARVNAFEISDRRWKSDSARLAAQIEKFSINFVPGKSKGSPDSSASKNTPRPTKADRPKILPLLEDTATSTAGSNQSTPMSSRTRGGIAAKRDLHLLRRTSTSATESFIAPIESLPNALLPIDLQATQPDKLEDFPVVACNWIIGILSLSAFGAYLVDLDRKGLWFPFLILDVFMILVLIRIKYTSN